MSATFSQLPIDLIFLIAGFLEIKDLVHFSALTRGIRHVSESIWKRLARQALVSWPVAPHSFDIETMSASDARMLATRPYRLEHLFLQSIPIEPQPMVVSMSPITPETTHLLDIPDGSSVEIWRALPGNRWVCAVLILEDGHMQLCVWDLQARGEKEAPHPALSITSLHEQESTGWPMEFRPQLDEERQVVNILLYYLIAGTEQLMLEVCQLAWDNGVPRLTRKASSCILWNDEQYLIDGHYVCIDRIDDILLWNWKEDTYGSVPTNMRDHGPYPFLMQPPYVLQRMGRSPKLSIITLEDMRNESASDPPIIPFTPADLGVIGDRENWPSMKPMSSGYRWAVPSQDIERETILFCKALQPLRLPRTYEGIVPYIWMSSVRAIERLPPILKPFDSINGHLRLPSGNILLTAGSSRTESVSSIPSFGEGFQDQRVTCGSFYIHPVTTETQKLGHLNLAIPHLGAKLSPPDISNLCPLSGTIVVGALESNKDYRGVLQLATIRLVALE